MVVHIYNPSHDEALALNRTHYCPSSAARRTGAMFWDVAKWWMAPGDMILRLPDDGSLRGVEVPDWTCVERIEPWGWDRHIVGVLRRLGAPERLLPTDGELDRIRELSSRHTAVKVLERLASIQQQVAEHNTPHPAAGALPILRAESRWCTTEGEVAAAIAAFGGRAMLKQPWSCSGRGVWSSEAPSSAARVLKTLREQGAVEAEPLYENRGDFAMEFFAAPAAPDGRPTVRYEGLSLFRTHSGGAYKGNVVAPEAELRRQLETEAGSPLPFDTLADLLATTLADLLAADYSGPLGVDMMLTPQGVHPCIEVNLRNTMGRVAIFQSKGQNAEANGKPAKESAELTKESAESAKDS